jgi:hypothetical protein
LNPYASSAVGSFAGGVVSSITGQILGNILENKPPFSLDPTLALASGFGSAAGTQLGNGLRVTNPYWEGVIGAGGELLFGIPTQAMSPGPINFCQGK